MIIQVSFFYDGQRLEIRHFSDWRLAWVARKSWAVDALHTSCVDSSKML